MKRLIFANQLRGVAALCVVLSHLVGVYWALRDFVGVATATPVQPGPFPRIFVLVGQVWFNFGPFGVAVFFLISGFVIPFSLARTSRGGFIAARLLRIYPCYVAALCLELAALEANALMWGRPFPYGGTAIWSNLLLVYSQIGQPSLDLVNWTLVVELKFYLIMAVAAPLVRRGSLGLLFGLAAAIVLVNLTLHAAPLADVIAHNIGVARQFSNDSLYLIFMFMGVLFNYHLRGLLRSAGLALALAGMLGLFLVCWQASLIVDQFPIVTVNYLYGLGLFGLAYLARGWARPVRLLDFFAAISFPLYLVHSLLGFSLLKLLTFRVGLPYVAALPLVFAAVVAVAWALHRSIETGSIVLGHKIAAQLGPRQRHAELSAASVELR